MRDKESESKRSNAIAARKLMARILNVWDASQLDVSINENSR